jgi:hypothetical protein
MIGEPRPLVEITQEALSLLYRELGLVNTVRFLSQFTTGFGNFTEERRTLIENESFDEVAAEIRAYQKARSANA